jgi:signal transduction histidine kinase/DNA-binding response OmpR family regulator
MSSFLDGGGELGALMRAHDWTKTPLGPPRDWPRSLKTAVRIMLTSRQPFWLGWGPELTYLYNDPYKSIIGGRHPSAFAQPAREVWPEIWHEIGPMVDTVMQRDQGTYVEAQLLIMERHGYQEETYYTFSYSPVPGDDGRTAGLICANTDDTRRVIGERQLATLRELAARTANARTWQEACTLSAQALATNARDLPFAVVYVEGALVGAAGIDAGRAQALPLPVAAGGSEARVVAADPAWTELPTGAWHRAPAQIALIPIAVSGESGRAGVLAVGLNPFRQFDGDYRGFLDLVAGQIAAGIANAQAYEQERKRAEALAELDRAKTAFFSNVSHEFRTPLTLMLGPLDEILSQPPVEVAAANRPLLEVAQRNGQRLLKLVNTLLDFARIEAGRTQASYEPTDLAAFTAELTSNFRSACGRAGIALEVDCPPLAEAAWVDREMWEKIVLNLVSNAFKFTLEGNIGVSLRLASDYFLLKVRDTGAGIPEVELPRMFERFHRVEGVRGRSHEGSGIGLALVQELVKLHGGSIGVESELGSGTTFTVHIPRGTAHLAADRIRAARGTSTAVRAGAYVDEALSWLPGAESAPEARKAGPRILLADDNADLREYARRLLAEDYEVEAVADGIAALDAARARPPALVVSDVMMPGLDGFGLIHELRADPKLRTVPIILLSARAGEEARVEGLGKGADDYLVKPFSGRELLVRVATLLRTAELRRQALDEQQRAADELREEARTLETLNRVGQTLAAELDLEKTVQTVTDAATELSGAEFGAFFYNVTNDAGESYFLYTLCGAPREAFAKFGMPRNTAVFAPTFAGEGLVRVDDITKDPRYGKNSPHHGMPKGHLPVRSYLAASVVSRTGEVIGGLFFGHSRPGVFTERSERLVAGIAAQAAVAIDNARLYEESRRLIERLSESDRRKDEFLATLSHELRNPLAPLRNSVQLLRMQELAHPAAAPIHQMMDRQVDHLVRLVDDLLEVSRISRGTFELRLERVELATVVRNAVDTSNPLIHAAGHQLTVSMPREPLWLDGDPVRLAQILANLLNNAATYTEHGGRISVQAWREDGHALVAVRDNGTGIAADALPRMFQMFHRGSASSRRNPSGLGIGLSLARGLAEMHGGTISLKSEGPGRGSEFTVRLPLAASEPAPAADRPADSMLPPRRVLVVDDNRDAGDSLGMLLKVLGAEVRVARDGAEALEAYSAYDPAVVLLDIGMPGMDGYEVARRIRARSPGPRPTIVALTGWGQEDDRRVSREAGFDHHMVKPAEIGALKELLRSIPA